MKSARGYVVGLIVLISAWVRTAPAQNGVPRPDHVVVVIEENRTFDRIIGSAEAPYINALARRGALFSSSYGIRHPSQPNYLALFSGSTLGVGDDSCPHTFHAPNLGRALLDAGLTFRGYSESMPRAGYYGCESGLYARKHNPWVNFANVPASANLTFTSFPTNFGELPTVSIVVPNLRNDMHDAPASLGDSWLHNHIEPYVQWAASNNSLFILTWDEGGGDNRIVTIFVGPMVRPGEYCERINHFNTLRTLLEMYGLAPIAKSATADPITSVWTPESVRSPLSITLTTSAAGLVLTEPATIALQADAVSTDSEVRVVEFYQRSTLLGSTTREPFTFTWTNVPAGSYCFVAKAADASGRRMTSLSIPVEVRALDVTPPGITITAPVQNARLTNGLVTLQGTASDDAEVERVEFQVGQGPIQIADGTTHWSAQLELSPGPSTIRAWSIDTATNRSGTATRSVNYVVLSLFTAEINGRGRIAPDLNGQNLEVGRSYQFKAVPDTGYVLAEPGVGAASMGPIRFLMESNLHLVVTFVPSPFPPVTGTYSGLIYNPDQLAPQSSGFFTLNLNARGGYTSRIELGGLSRRASGFFDAFGRATSTLTPRRPDLFLAAEWQLDLTGGSDQIRGSIHQSGAGSGDGDNSVPIAGILGDRDVFRGTTNDFAQAGHYTIVFSHDTNGVAGPDGDGFGAMTVDNKGRIRIAGALADGTKLTRSATLSKAGQWPLYAPISGGQGVFLGWMGFGAGTANAFGGGITWIMPGRPDARYYPGGFTNECVVFGSAYHPPSGPGDRLLHITNAVVTFEGGGLGAALTNRVRLESNNTVSDQGSNHLALVFAKKTGLWRGTILEPGATKPILFRGVVLQTQNAGTGFFLTTNQSGRVRLEPFSNFE